MVKDTAYDVAIVGSGPAGGRMARELTRRGMRCVLLEAGGEWNRSTFPARELDYTTQMFWGGGLEVTTDGRLGLLRGKCLGGTSVLNQALLDRFDDDAWSAWRERSGVEWLRAETMDDHYRACEDETALAEIPREHWNHNAQLYVDATERAGYGWAALRRGQSDCRLDLGSDCIRCLGGCPRDSKQSSLVTTIRQARADGLAVLTRCEVHHLEERAGGIRLVGTHEGQPWMLDAPRVVLAAGSLGTTALLLRSGLGDRLPALGRGFACHPQLMSYGWFDEPVDAHKGAFQTVKSADPRLRAMRVKLENVFAPPIGTSMLMPGNPRTHARRMRDYRYLASIEVAVRDEATGTVAIDRTDRITVSKRLTRDDWTAARRGLDVVQELLVGAGARDTVACTDAFGLHLMGGCAIGTDPAMSVVAPDFRVHGTERVHVVDSSLFPSAPGINPSLTIMALAHRAAAEVT